MFSESFILHLHEYILRLIQMICTRFVCVKICEIHKVVVLIACRALIELAPLLTIHSARDSQQVIGGLRLLFWLCQIRHINFEGRCFIHKDVGLDKFRAILIILNFHVEDSTEHIQ